MTSFMSVIVLLLLVAQENKLISIPALTVPQLFRFGEESVARMQSYVIDVSVENCLRVNLKNRDCVVKDESKGYQGDLRGHGGWSVVDKDLSLGKSLLYKQHLGLKLAVFNNGEQPKYDVVVDVAVSDPVEDGKIKHNEKALIPEKVLKDIHKSRVFDEENQKQLEEANKDEVLDGKVDADEITKLKQEQESQAEDLRASTEKEKQEKEQGKEQEKEKEAKVEGPEEKPQDPEADKAKSEKDSTKPKRDLETREKKSSYHELDGFYLIPNAKQLEEAKWRKSSNGIWLKYGPQGKKAVTWINVVFGPDAVVPFEDAVLIKQPLLDTGAAPGLEPRIAIRREGMIKKTPLPELRFKKNGKFKILQVADLHFSTGVGKCRDPFPEESAEDCEADPRTIRFINRVLDLEKPDFVALTGDQIFGDDAPDPMTALFKAVAPFEKRKIPYGLVLGNHDDQLTYDRESLMYAAAAFPYSMATPGPKEVEGYGNYGISVTSHKMLKKVAAALYFLDSHAYSKKPKTNPGYDWFKDSQMWWLEQEAGGMAEQMVKENRLSMAFFHIPIPEFKNIDSSDTVGKKLEGIAAPRYNSGMRTHFANANVQVAAVGHDHCNDYCLLDIENRGEEDYESKMWLCYGGGVGEGGYGGYGGYIRRLRVYELDEDKGSIRLWKRAENDPNKVFDKHRMVNNGVVLN